VASPKRRAGAVASPKRRAGAVALLPVDARAGPVLTNLIEAYSGIAKGVVVRKTIAEDFAALYKKINADGALDDFFHHPESFGKGSNDFAAVMLLLGKLSLRLPSAAAQRAKRAEALCRQAVDADIEPLDPHRPEWELIQLLMAALADCAAHGGR